MSAGPKEAAALAARIDRDALDVRQVAEEIQGWVAA